MCLGMASGLAACDGRRRVLVMRSRCAGCAGASILSLVGQGHGRRGAVALLLWGARTATRRSSGICYRCFPAHAWLRRFPCGVGPAWLGWWGRAVPVPLLVGACLTRAQEAAFTEAALERLDLLMSAHVQLQSSRYMCVMHVCAGACVYVIHVLRVCLFVHVCVCVHAPLQPKHTPQTHTNTRTQTQFHTIKQKKEEEEEEEGMKWKLT